MGIFSTLADAWLEGRLEQTYAASYLACCSTREDALKHARDFIQRAKTYAAQQGWERDPPNLGDRLLDLASSDASVRERLEMLYAEGVQDEDIRWWWNMRPLERATLELSNEESRLVFYIAARDSGMGKDNAAAEVRRRFPIWGNPSQGAGEDRPLPIELQRRVVEFSERLFRDPEEFNRLTKRATSFNALVREAIRMGVL